MRAIALLLSLTVVTSSALARAVNGTITAVPGIRVGHHTLYQPLTQSVKATLIEPGERSQNVAEEGQSPTPGSMNFLDHATDPCAERRVQRTRINTVEPVSGQKREAVLDGADGRGTSLLVAT